MSHFTVVVIGPNVDEQLAPYDENFSVEPYRTPVDESELTRMLTHYAQHLPGPKTKVGRKIRKAYGSTLPVVVTAGQVESPTHDVVTALFSEWGGDELFRDAQGYYRYSRYNPQSKWDWYQIGGRWTGYFRRKPGAEGVLGERSWASPPPEPDDVQFADVIYKRDIDVEWMREQAATAAAEYWDRVEALVKEHRPIELWSQVLEREPDVEKARKIYHAQPGIQAFAKAGRGLFDDDDDILKTSRDVWVSRARAAALTPYSYLKDGIWHQRGQMGWFGMSRDEKDEDAWNQEFNTMFEALPDDTLFTVVDCHI